MATEEIEDVPVVEVVGSSVKASDISAGHAVATVSKAQILSDGPLVEAGLPVEASDILGAEVSAFLGGALTAGLPVTASVIPGAEVAAFPGGALTTGGVADDVQQFGLVGVADCASDLSEFTV